MTDWAQWVANLLPMVILVGLWWYFMRRMKGSNWQASQKKHLELMEAQLAALRETNELLRKMVEGR